MIKGEIQHADEAVTNVQSFNFGVEAEEAFWFSEWDKKRMAEFVDKSIRIIILLQKIECRFYQFRCRRLNKEIDESVEFLDK